MYSKFFVTIDDGISCKYPTISSTCIVSIKVALPSLSPFFVKHMNSGLFEILIGVKTVWWLVHHFVLCGGVLFWHFRKVFQNFLICTHSIQVVSCSQTASFFIFVW